MAWATTAEVASITGVADVASTALAAAQTSIELHAGRIPADVIADRDLHWLRCAVAYQAVWIAAQPDYLERRDASAESADGASITNRNADSVTLAPLARKALRRLSFRGPRAIRPVRLGAELSDDVVDDRLPWQPL